MRICYTGPKNLHTERWVTYFARHGHEVHLVIDEMVDYDGVVVHPLHLTQKKSVRYFTRKLLGLNRVLERIKPDVLHTHYITGEGYVSALTGFHPYVITIWGNDIYLRPHTGFDERWFTRLVLKRADLVTADSRDQIEAAVKLGALREKCRVIQWGVDVRAFHPGVSSDVRARLGIPDDAPVVISQRKFTSLYNIDLVIEAFCEALQALPAAHLILTGGGFDEEGMKALVRKLGIAHRAHFTGYLPYDELPRYLVAADVAVSVPTSDGTAMALLEAMACGVSLIATDLPSTREWITDGENGLLVPVRDRAALGRHLVALLKDRPRRMRFRARNIALIHEQANHEVNMQKMETLYHTLAASG